LVLRVRDEAAERRAAEPVALVGDDDPLHVRAEPPRAQVERDQVAGRRAVALDRPVLAPGRGDRRGVLLARPAADERRVGGVALEREPVVEGRCARRAQPYPGWWHTASTLLPSPSVTNAP